MAHPVRAMPYLEHFPEPGAAAHRVPLEPLPFRIGRSTSAHFIVYSRRVSKEHAEVFERGGGFYIRDTGSTNGTFVNGRRVPEAPLANGDIIHVAHVEFRFGLGADGARDETARSFTEVVSGKVPASVIRGGQHLRELMVWNNVRVDFQPIVDLQTGAILGYEALGRGTHSELSANPGDLFSLASQCNLAGELSRVFRLAAVGEAVHLPAAARVFFNLHPSELLDDSLIGSLRDLKGALQDTQKIVLEVHEGVVADLATLRRFRAHLKALDIELAYDDFGSGQSRLNELAEVPPDFIKLDKCLIQGIDGSPARMDLVRALTWVNDDLGVRTIAEGIETLDEAKTCLGLRCHYGQGFLFGRPQPLAALDTKSSIDFGARP